MSLGPHIVIPEPNTDLTDISDNEDGFVGNGSEKSESSGEEWPEAGVRPRTNRTEAEIEEISEDEADLVEEAGPKRKKPAGKEPGKHDVEWENTNEFHLFDREAFTSPTGPIGLPAAAGRRSGSQPYIMYNDYNWFMGGV